MKIGDVKIGDTYKYMSPSSPIFRAKPGYEASRLAGPASGRRKEYPERSRADSLTMNPEARRARMRESSEAPAGTVATRGKLWLRRPRASPRASRRPAAARP